MSNWTTNMVLSLGLSCIALALFFGLTYDGDKQDEVELNWDVINLILDYKNSDTGLSNRDTITDYTTISLVLFIVMAITIVTIRFYLSRKSYEVKRENSNGYGYDKVE